MWLAVAIWGTAFVVLAIITYVTIPSASDPQFYEKMDSNARWLIMLRVVAVGPPVMALLFFVWAQALG